MPPVIILTPTKALERTEVFTGLAYVLTALAWPGGVFVQRPRVRGHTSRRPIRLAMPEITDHAARGEPPDHMRRQTRGVMSICRVKTRLKWLWSAKPQPKPNWDSSIVLAKQVMAR
jgi:hypothetical protein